MQLLDQRVSQLERASLREPTTTTWSSEPQATAPVVEAPAPKSSAPSKTITPSLKPSKKEIQQALKNAGFYQGSIDGKIGPQTYEAIKTFQQVHGLKADGIVGKQTWEKLAPYLTLSGGGGEVSAAETLK